MRSAASSAASSAAGGAASSAAGGAADHARSPGHRGEPVAGERSGDRVAGVARRVAQGGLDGVYVFDPVRPGLSAAEVKSVLGGQTNIPTEHMDSPRMLDYFAFLRLAAVGV